MVFRACAMQTECLTCKNLAQSIMFAATYVTRHFTLSLIAHSSLTFFFTKTIFSAVSAVKSVDYHCHQYNGGLEHIPGVRETAVAFSISALDFLFASSYMKPYIKI